MDNSNWRPSDQSQGQAETPSMDGGDWRTQLQADSRQRIVNKIMDTLKRHLPFSGQDGIHELKKIAVRFEEKIYSAAISQPDYLRRISLKMLSMESKSQITVMNNPIQSNPPSSSNNTPDSASQNMQSQVQNPGQSLCIPSANIQPQQHPQLSQNIQTSISSAGVQGSVLPPVSGLTQTPIQNSVGQNSNMLNISGMVQNPLGNSMGLGAASGMFVSSQRQMPMRQLSQQQQQQQYLYQQQIQPLLKPKSNHGNMSQSFMQSHIQQQQEQQQQNISQQNQLQLSQQSLMQTSSVLQPSLAHSAPLSSLQQNQQSPVQQSTQSVLQQHQQSFLRHQQQNATNMQPNQILVQQNNVSDIQLQQQQQYQQRLPGQQNNVSSLQPQPVMSQQNNLSGAQQQQQQLSNECSGHMLQQPKVQQQPQQTVQALLSSQGQQSHGQQQLTSQQPFSMQQQQTLLPPDMQRVPASGLLQPQMANDQQRQIFESTRPNPEAPSSSSDSTAQTGNANVGDWKEDVFRMIQTMKEKYLPELSEVLHKIALKIHQHESLHQQRPPQFEKFKAFKALLEQAIAFLQVTKNDITLAQKEKLGMTERQIVYLLNMSRSRKPAAPQQGQISSTNLQSFQQIQHQQSQIAQVHSHENQMNHPLQSMISQGSAPVLQNSMTSLQHGGNSFSGSQNVQPSMINALQAAPNVESGQCNALSSLQQAAVGTLQQNPVSAPPQANGVNLLPTHQSNSSVLQQQNLKQQQGQQMLQAQQLKHSQFLHRQPQLMPKQQPQQQPPSQQLKQSISLQAHPMSQLQPMTDANDLKMKQGLNVKPGVFQQHPLATQSLKSAYHHQQLKPGSTFPASSPQLLQAVSPQVPQQASPQFDQPNMPNVQKTGASFQIPNSAYITPSPSTPLVPSPLPGDFEKHNSSISSHSNTVNVSHQQGTGAVTAAQSLAIGTPGISASPLLAEASSPDVNKYVSIAVTGKSSLTEQPLERLLKAVKTVSSQALISAVNDIASVVSMIDRVAGSAPGNGSRVAVGEDLVAMTKCRLQAKNIASIDGTSGTKKMRRHTSAMPLNITSSVGSVTDSLKQLNGAMSSDLESTATSSNKKPRIEANYALAEEIKEINQHLIDTVVDMGGEDFDPNAFAQGSEGTIVKCCFMAVSLSPNLKSQYTSARMSPIMSIRVLVPPDYPSCSPVLLDKIPVEISKGNEDLPTKVKARFNMALRSLSQPMSLRDVAKTWDVCVRTVITEYAVLKGGGTFSTRYGTWEKYSIEA